MLSLNEHTSTVNFVRRHDNFFSKTPYNAACYKRRLLFLTKKYMHLFLKIAKNYAIPGLNKLPNL